MLRVRSLVAFVCVGFVLCVMGPSSVYAQAVGLRRITNTTEEGLSLNPSLSGDGLRVAFESTEDIAHAGGNDHFRAIRADVSTEPPTFIQMGGTRAVAPAISQDGSHIAFASKDNPVGTNQDGNSEIFLFDGATLRQITNTSPGQLADRVRNGNFQPSISDDGRFIAFASNRDLVGLNPDANLEIFIYDAVTLGFTQLTNTLGTVGASDAKISGNGARVAYIRDGGATPSTQRDLVILDRTGGAAQVAAASVAGLAFTYGRATSDDGTRVVFAAETATQNSTQVFLFDGRSLNLIRPITFLGARATDVPLHPTISGDGSRIAFATRRTVLPEEAGSSVDLYTFDIPTGQFARVTNTLQSTTEAQSTPSAEVVSSLSDDGKVVAFNFPRLLSGAVTFPELGNNSEIYLTATTPRAPFGNLTVLNGASFGNEPSSTKAVAPDSIAVGLGGALANSTEQSQRQAGGSFPRNVGGTTVTVNGREAQIFFVSPAQVNFLVPPETELGIANVVITASDGFQTRGTVTVMRSAPGIFTYSGDGRGDGVILDADMLRPGPFDPTSGHLRLIVCTTGLRNATQIVVTIGGRVVTVESVVRSPTMPGLDELHLLLPADLHGAGPVEMFVRADGRDSNPVNIDISGEVRRDAVINEVLADPPDGPPGDANHDGTRDTLQDEFVEIVNVTASDIDMSNFELLSRGTGGSQNTLRHRFAAGTILPPGGAIVVFGGGNSNFNPNNPIFGGAQVVKASTGSLSLVNSGGLVILREPSGAVVSLFSYGGSTNLNADANQSLTRSPDMTGDFTGHLSAPHSDGRAYSPGTRVDGSPFLSPVIGRIEVMPASASIFVGQHQQFTATAYDTNGDVMSGVIFLWQSSNGAVVTINQNGQATGVSQGTAEIRAFARGVQSPPATVTVSPTIQVLTRIEVIPSTATIPAGGAQSFSAKARDQFDNEMMGVTFAWSSSDTNIATIDPASGLATGVSQGSVTITATAQNVNGTATLNVTPPTVVINEVLADPPDGLPGGDANHDGVRDSGDDEFVELVNTTGAAISIAGWTLRTRALGGSNETLRHRFAAGTTLPAGDAIVVFGGGNPDPQNPAFGGAQVVTASTAGLSLTNSGLHILVHDAAGNIITQFTYGETGELRGDQNQSLTRSPDTTGGFVEHTNAAGAGGRRFSPGTKVDGSPFVPRAGQLTGITISPSSADVFVGQTAQFTARALDQFGQTMKGLAITFASSNTGVATIESVSTDPATGIATATVMGHSAGAAQITASTTDGSTTVTSNPATLNVATPPPRVTRIEVSPATATINRGRTQQFTATAFDGSNPAASGVSFTWTSSDTNIATVNANGLATGVGIGMVTITATAQDGIGGTTSGQATLTVQVPLVLNEILADPPDTIIGDANRDGVRDGDNDEFVELVNNSNDSVNISGVIIADATSNRFTFPANTTLAAGRAVVIFGGGSPPVNDPSFGGALIFTASSLGLNNPTTGTTETVTVKLRVAGVDIQIDAHTYGTEGAENNALTRSPDITGEFSSFSLVSEGQGRNFAPGTRLDGTPFGSPPITRIEITPASATIDFGQTQVFTGHAFSNSGGPEVEVPNVCFLWFPTNSGIAPLSPRTGQSTTATGTGGGTLTFNARAGGQQGTASITVNPAPPVLTSVTISPTSTSIVVGQTQQFTAQALDQYGQPIAVANITFASNNTTVATVDSVTMAGDSKSATAIVTGHNTGSAEIRATATDGTHSPTSNPATLTVMPVVNPGDVLISEFRTRGPSGLSDEFIEIYNPTASSVPIGGLKIRASNGSGGTSDRATIPAGTTLGSGCHYLLAQTSSYSGSVTPDQTYGTAIADTGGIAITRSDGTTIIDQVGMSNGSAYKEGTTLAAFTSDVDQSYERKPGGASGNGTDTNNNASDFFLNASSSNPQNLSSGCLNLSTADLGITKTDLPDPVVTGSDVTYTITVTNHGPGPAQSVVVTDNLPGTVSFVSCSSTGGGVCNSGTGNNRTVTFSSLQSGASATITLVATANGAGGTTITNTATVTSATSDTTSGNNSATETTNVQAVTPTLSINDVTITEGDSGTKTVGFTVTLSPASAQTVTVGYATSSASPATATAGTDYQSTSDTLTFNPGETGKLVNITITGDTLVEPDETFFVDLSGATNANISDSHGVGTIINDDTANLAISQIYGGGGNASATYSNDFIEIFNRGTTTVNFAVTPYSVQYAGAASNFGAANTKTDITSGTIAPGQYFLIHESAPSTPTGAALPSSGATGNINLATSGGKVALVSGTAAVTPSSCPGDDLGTVPLNPTDNNIVDFVGYGNSASCYEGAGPAPAHANATADFRKVGGCTDTNDNAADFFVYTPTPRNTASPLNDCSAGRTTDITINNVTVTEGNSGTVPATFTVSLHGSSASTVTVDYATTNGTATAPADYQAIPTTTLTFNPGEVSKTITVNVNGDAVDESDETFFVNLTNATNAVILDNQGQGTITDDDLPPTLTVSDVSLNEGNSSTTIFAFNVHLSAPAPAGGVTFDIATQDDTATVADNDYVVNTLTGQTIAAGSQDYTFNVTVNGDAAIESNETFFVNVTNISGATVGDSQGLGTIQNDDSPALSINDVTQSEGNAGTKTFSFNVHLSQPAPAGGVTFNIATQDNTATVDDGNSATISDNDYVARSLTAQTIPEGSQDYTFDVTVNGDLIVEPDESFFVNLSGATNATISDGQGVGTITNDDTADLVVSQIYGGGGNASATYKNDFIEIFNRGTTTVDFSVTHYSVQYASAGVAFGSSKTDLTSGTISPGHYFLIQESGGTTNGAALPAPDAVGTIPMGNTSGKVALVSGTTFLPAFICPGDDGIAPFNPNDATIVDFIGYGSVSCYEGAGPASAPSNTTADFRKAGGCTDTNDNAADFFVHTPIPRNTGSPANNCSAVTTPNLTIDNVTVTEGNSGAVTATFTVSLSAPASGADVTFDIATADGTAQDDVPPSEDNDYVAKSLTNQIIPAGQQTYTFNVTVNGDTAIEPDETFLVNVTNVSGATLLDGQGVGTIQHDDLPSLSISDVTQSEGNSGTTFTFTVSLSSLAPAEVTFDIATADGTAQDDVPPSEDNDYIAKSQTGRTIAAGSQTFTFDVTVNGDTAIESNETFFVNVTNISGATVGDSQGLGTIQNDDSPALSINDVTMTEGNAGTKTFSFNVHLSLPAPAGGVTFNIATQDNTATVDDGNPSTIGDNDYVAKSLTAQTIPEGSQNYTFDVTVNGDLIVEPDETFFVNVTSVSGATVTDGQGSGTIQNDDTPLLVISQIYGGGGNASATYKNDFIEIFNRGTTTVNLSGYSVQYAPATSATFTVIATLTNVYIAPGQYYLIKAGPVGATGADLPTPDVTGTTTDMAVSGGKVALVNGTTAITGSTTSPTSPLASGGGVGCPTSSNIVDFVGYGSTATCFEGLGRAPAASNNARSVQRKSGGCQDTNDNAQDFTAPATAPVARNTATTPAPCPP